jgi:hypothetical protein
MSLNLFKRVEAEPLVFTRILRPPVLRRISGDHAASIPTAIRWSVRRIAGGNSAAHPLELPAKLPGDCREVAGKMSSGFLASRRTMSWQFPLQCRRSSVGFASASSVHPPVSFPSYARH